MSVISDYSTPDVAWGGAILLWLWRLLLLLHFGFFQLGIGLMLCNYHVLHYDLSFTIPQRQVEVKAEVVGLFLFFTNIVGFSTLFAPSTIDIILFSIWNLLFFDEKQRLQPLLELTSQKCDVTLEGMCVVLLIICVINFHNLHPFLTSAVFLLVYFALKNMYRHHPSIREPLYDYEDRTRINAIVFIGLFSFVIQILRFDRITTISFVAAVAVAVFQALLIPLVACKYDDAIVRVYYNDFFSTSTGQSLLTYFVSVKFKSRFFQLFFVYYFCQMTCVLWGRF
jgi:hypothetical protein